MRARLSAAPRSARRSRDDSLAGRLSAGRLFPAGAASRSSAGAGDHLHRRTRPAQGRVPLQGRAPRRASAACRCSRSISRGGAGGAVRRDRGGRPIWRRRSATSWTIWSSASDVDADRIAILADGWGSSFVARGIAFDDRFAAAVCDGGIWDLHERAFLIDRTRGRRRTILGRRRAQPGRAQHQMPGADLDRRARLAEGRARAGTLRTV